MHFLALLHILLHFLSLARFSHVGVVVVVVGGGFVGGAEVVPPTTGQLEAQKPHLPWPLTWSSLESVSVEHHGSVSSGALPSKVHSLYRTPRNLNGNTHDSPLTVVQPDGGEGVVPGGETVVPDGLLGHSVVPVVDLTQSMTSGKTNHFSKGL